VCKYWHQIFIFTYSAGSDALHISDTRIIISKKRIRGEKENAFRLIGELVLSVNPSHIFSFEKLLGNFLTLTG